MEKLFNEVTVQMVSDALAQGPIQVWFFDGLTCFLTAHMVGTDTYIAQWSLCCGSKKEFVVHHEDIKKFTFP
jgi:uncharacterized membrane protein YhhN